MSRSSHKKKSRRSRSMSRQKNNDIDSILSQAKWYTGKKEYRRAVKCLQKAVALDAGRADIHGLLGENHLKLGDHQAAEASCRTALELYQQESPENDHHAADLAKAWIALAECYRNRNDFHTFYYYENALRIEPLNELAADKSSLISKVFINMLADNWHIGGQLSFPIPPLSKKEKRPSLNIALKLPELSGSNDQKDQKVCELVCKKYAIALLNNASKEEQNAFIDSIGSEKILPLLNKHPRAFTPLGDVLCAVVSRILTQPPFKVELNLFALPPLIEKYGWKTEAKQYLQPLRDTLRANINGLIPVQQCAAHILLLLLDAFSEGVGLALRRFFDYWQKQAGDRLQLVFTAPLWRQLYRTGWIHETNPELFKQVMHQYANLLGSLDDKQLFFKETLIRDLLRFNLHSSRAWNALIFNGLVLPNIHQALKTGHYLSADRLTSMTDFSYAQQPHTEEQCRLCWEAYVPAVLEAGRKIYSSLAPLQWRHKTGTSPVIGFVINLMFNNASPIKVIFQMLSSVAKLNPKPFVARIYAMETTYEPMVNQFKDIGVPVISMDELCGKYGKDNFLQRLLALRDIMRKDEVAATVYVQSSLFFSTFAAAVGLSPVQVFCSMGGYYTFRIKEIQGYIGGSGVARDKTMFHGYEWRSASGKISEYRSADPMAEEQARQIRTQQFGDYEILLGSIGRPQKIDSEEFLDALAEILRNNPNAAFLWFGDEELVGVKQKMQTRGIADRCLFQGFVNTKLYARILDIHLDSFPFPAGITMYESMAAGTPAVFFLSKEALHTGVLINIHPLFSGEGTPEQQRQIRNIFSGENGENLFLCAKDLREYIEYTQRLIDDPAFRHAAGKACNAYIEAFLEDEAQFGESFSRHILEIIEEVRLSTIRHNAENCSGHLKAVV